MNTTILLCSHGLDLDADPSERDDVTVIADLCQNPYWLTSEVGDSDRLVLGLCQGEYSLGEIQAEVRRAGIDPLGVELIDLSSVSARDDSFDLLLNAKAARAEAFAGSSPANAKISAAHSLSRRELLRGPLPEYHAAPSIDPELCAARSGCRACVDICPQQALSLHGRRVQYDRSLCEPCGLCVTTCPTGATVNPAITTSQLEAEIDALLDPSVGTAGSRAIAFVCSRGRAPAAMRQWHTVSVPCTGMVPPGWMLAPLLMGAAAVAALPCGDSGCWLGHDARTHTAVEFSRSLLGSFGDAPERVSTDRSDDLPEPLPQRPLTDPFGPHGAVEVMRVLGRVHDKTRVVIDHPAAPTGVVHLNADACTGCTMCCQTCPTGALASSSSDDRVAISFDAARCTACQQCVRACPELERGAISLRPGVDLAALSSGPTTLIEMQTIRCETCGEAIAPEPMMERIAGMLSADQEPIRAMIMSHCVVCRGRGRVFAR